MTMIELADGKIINFLTQPADSYQQSKEAWASFAPDARTIDYSVVEWLHRTKSGRYVLIGFAKEGPAEVKRAEYLDSSQAARWLLLNQHAIPEDLKAEAESLAG